MTTPNDNAGIVALGQNGSIIGADAGLDGSVAMKLLQSNFNVNTLRPQTLLQYDEWKAFDNVVTEVARANLIGIGDLMKAGLTYNLPNALGKTLLQWEKVSDMAAAEVSMSGVSEGQNDKVDFGLDTMPIPIIHKEFNLNIRQLASSRNKGEPLDTTQIAYATRKVVEQVESILFKGSTVLGTGHVLYGYTTQTYRTTGSVTATWVTATGDQIITDLLNMINAAIGKNFFGPYMLYVPLAVYTNMLRDLKANSDKSIISRIKEIPSIVDVKASYLLTGTNIILVQMTRDVVELIDGIQPTLVQWDSRGGFTQHFKIIAIMPPRFKNDYLNQSGIVHYS